MPILKLKCDYCLNEFEKYTSPSRQRKYTFCSTSCSTKFQARALHPEYVDTLKLELKCAFCDKKIERYISPKNAHKQLFCSRSCSSKFICRQRNPNCGESSVKKFICEFCNEDFEKDCHASRTYRFCSIKCSTSFCAKGRTDEKRYIKWVEKFGKEEADVRLANLKQKRSNASTEFNIQNKGVPRSLETKKKISDKCKGIPNLLKGKTFIEFYGENRAKELSSNHSQKLLEGFASGKLSPTVRTRQAPTYKNVKLRSLLEQRAIVWLEETYNLSLNETLLYEPKDKRVMWHNEKGSHTYSPDLYDAVNHIVYEVKPQWQVNKPTEEMLLKQQAVLDAGERFEYLTDIDIKNIKH